MLNVILFLPSRIYAGAERQFILLAEHLYQLKDVNVTLIDSDVGVISKNLKHLVGLKVITYIPGSKIVINNSVVILPASYMFTIGCMFDFVRCDVRYWFLSPFNLPNMYVALKFKGVMASITRNFCKALYLKKLKKSENQLYFMHKDTKNMIESFYGVNFSGHTMSLLVDLSQPDDLLGWNDYKKGVFAWIGRLDKGVKSIPVKRLLYDLKTLNKFELHIIGDGDGASALKNIAIEYGVSDRVVFHGYIKYNQLHTVLGFCQVVFAHGTSIYEGVRCHTPVVVFDLFLDEKGVDIYKYNFYNDRESTELGTIVTNPYSNVFTNGHSLEEVMSITSNNESRKLLINNALNKAKLTVNKDLEELTGYFTNKPLDFTHAPYCMYLDVLFWKIFYFIKRFF